MLLPAAALLMACLGTVLEPAALTSRRVYFDDQGAAWLVIEAQAPAGGAATIAWPQAEAGLDVASARLLSLTPQATEVRLRRETADGPEWVLLPPEGMGALTVSLAARLPDLKLEVQHFVAATADAADWTCMGVLSGWKGAPAEGMPVVAPAGRLDAVVLAPDVTQTLPLWKEAAVSLRQVVRWDSKENREPAGRYLYLDRTLQESFGVRYLQPGKLNLQLGTLRWALDFPGANPGQRVELRAGDADGVTVKRLRAASTQVDLKTDTHRRLAAFTDRLDYEYDALNTSGAPVDLEIAEHPAHGWRVDRASCDWERQDADTVILRVKLPAGATVRVTATLLRPGQTPA